MYSKSLYFELEFFIVIELIWDTVFIAKRWLDRFEKSLDKKNTQQIPQLNKNAWI